MLDGFAHGANAFALDENLARLKQSAGIYLKKPRGVKDDRRSGGLLRGGEGCACNEGFVCNEGGDQRERSTKRRGTEAPKIISHGYDYAAVGRTLSMKNYIAPPVHHF